MGEPRALELDAYLTGERELPLSDWVWGLSRWGRRPLVLAAIAVAESCLDIWRHGVPEDAAWQRHFARTPEMGQAIDALRAWLREGDTDAEHALPVCLAAVRDQVHQAEFYADESSGDADRCGRRERCAAAGRVVQFALEAATWTEARATAGIPDEAERQSIASTGPALEAVTAVREYRTAHHGVSEATARDLIRRALQAA